MKRIFKYTLKVVFDQQIIKLPFHYRILTIQNQNDIPTMWCEVDSSDKEQEICIAMYGTGNVMRNINQEYIATVQMSNGLVWHFYFVN